MDNELASAQQLVQDVEQENDELAKRAQQLMQLVEQARQALDKAKTISEIMAAKNLASAVIREADILARLAKQSALLRVLDKMKSLGL